jgi:serine/threonine protein kinase
VRHITDRMVHRLRQACEFPDLANTKYRLVAKIASGGMGTVYEVEDTHLNRHVALKVINVIESDGHATAEAISRMWNEARTVARLEHPSIVPIHDVGVLPDGRVFYVMKLVRGTRLDEFRKLTPSSFTLLQTFQKICDAVSFAHNQGVIHRDLKPENIIVGSFGEVLIMDWGVARVAGDLETHGVIVGTPAYMAPEQARGEIGNIGECSDVYSLGAILRFLLSDVTPQPPPLRAIYGKAMSPNPADRYQRATDLAGDVANYLDGMPVSAYRENLFERLRRWVLRNRTAAILIATYVLVRALFLLFFRR